MELLHRACQRGPRQGRGAVRTVSAARSDLPRRPLHRTRRRLGPGACPCAEGRAYQRRVGVGEKRPGVLRARGDRRRDRAGADWDLELAHAQKDALISVVLVSAKSDQAYYEREEIAAAIALARVDDRHRVVPVFLELG